MSRYASLPGGATLFYTDDGAGDTLLLVHGWTCDSNDYLWQVAHFRSTCRVIAPDLRGHGRSAVLPHGYDARTLARDLVELLDLLGVATCVAVGHSLGGLIVSVMAVEYPERVRAVVCLDPAYGVDDAELLGCRALLERMSGTDWPCHIAREFASWERPSTPAYFRELHVRRMLSTDRAVVRETFQQLFGGTEPLAGRARSEAYLARRACPVLVISALGGRERVEWESRLSRHPASRFLHLPLGHWPQQDAPDLINQLLEQWLDALCHGPRHQESSDRSILVYKEKEGLDGFISEA
jgi:pimeloyl-ACP methyl ester carboxylesterase